MRGRPLTNDRRDQAVILQDWTGEHPAFVLDQTGTHYTVELLDGTILELSKMRWATAFVRELDLENSL